MYEQKKVITITTVFTTIVCIVGVHVVFIIIYYRSCVAYTRHIILFILPCAASIVQSTILLCLAVGVYIYYTGEKNLAHTWCVYKHTMYDIRMYIFSYCIHYSLVDYIFNGRLQSTVCVCVTMKRIITSCDNHVRILFYCNLYYYLHTCSGSFVYSSFKVLTVKERLPPIYNNISRYYVTYASPIKYNLLLKISI